MSDINARASAVFTIGGSQLIDYFKALGHREAHDSCPGAALRLPCAFVFANKEDMCL